jgi:hypothetical protein
MLFISTFPNTPNAYEIGLRYGEYQTDADVGVLWKPQPYSIYWRPTGAATTGCYAFGKILKSWGG